MKKIIIYEPGNVHPIWPEMGYTDFDRLARTVVRSAFWDNKRMNVLDVPPIVVAEIITGMEELILSLDGAHRCVAALKKGVPLRGCLIETVNDIYNHLPQECLISLSKRIDQTPPIISPYSSDSYIDGDPIDWAREYLRIAFENRHLYIKICENKGVRTMHDLLKNGGLYG